MTRDEAADVLIARLLTPQREGGIGDPHDGKGTTYFGQTLGWLREFGFEIPYTPDAAAQNYRTWLVRTGLIGVCAVPDALADVVVDLAVNSDRRQSVRMLQRALGLTGPAVDGIWGPDTQRAVDACDRHETAIQLIADRLRFLALLIRSDPDRRRFAAAWFERNGDVVEGLRQRR